MTEYITLKVEPEDGGWTVRRNGGAGSTSRHADRSEAVSVAHRLAREAAPSHIVVHDEEGNVVWSAVFSGNGDDELGQEALPWSSDPMAAT